MDPITTALVAALTVGLNEVGKDAAKEAYTALKTKIIGLFNHAPQGEAIFEQLEHRPESLALQQSLNQALVQMQAETHPEINTLVSALLDKLNALESGRSALSGLNVNAEKIGSVVTGPVHQINQNF